MNRFNTIFFYSVYFFSGVIFAIGLALSGMTNPENIISFLDITGSWKPNMIIVMVSAIFATFLLYRLSWKIKKPIYSSNFYLPQKKYIDLKLISGAILFGVGWGISGICPGPAIVSLVTLNLNFILFVIFMLLGMFIYERSEYLFSK